MPEIHWRIKRPRLKGEPLMMRSSVDSLLHVGIEAVRLDRRLATLTKVEGQAERAHESFVRIRRPRNLRIRIEFAMRSNPAEPNGNLSDRLLPPRNDRPPAARLVSPRGIALRLYLTALFVAQSRSPGDLPGNKLPLADADAPVSWIDLIATTAEPIAAASTAASVRRSCARCKMRYADYLIPKFSL
jgi:hypothetical protein